MQGLKRLLNSLFAATLAIIVWMALSFTLIGKFSFWIVSLLPPDFGKLSPSEFTYLSPAISAFLSGLVISILNRERLTTLVLGILYAGFYVMFYTTLNPHFFSKTSTGLILGTITMAVAVSIGHNVGTKKLRGVGGRT